MTLQAIRHNLSKLPLLTPLVDPEGFKKDQKAVDQRVYKLAIAAFAFFVASIFTITIEVIGAPCILTVYAIGAIALVGWWITERAIDDKAVQEYISAPYPDNEATQRIRQSAYAIDQLIEKKANLNKRDRAGCYLLDASAIYLNFLHFDNFKLLIEHGADLNKKTGSRTSTFIESILAGEADDKTLEYLFKNNLLTPEKFTPEQQVGFWLHARGEKAFKLLQKNKFDVNVRDQKGYSPLLNIVSNVGKNNVLNHEISQIRNLLNCGAHPSLTIEGKEVHASELTTDQRILDILNKQGLC